MTDKKPTKTEIKRARQKVALVDAAQNAIARDGLSGLKARELADEIGIALGSIYNLVNDMDELILMVGSRTLQRLNQKLDTALSSLAPEMALERLIAIGQAYHQFADENYHLWRTLFEHHIAEDKELPAWASEERRRPFTRVIEPLKKLMPQASDEEIALFSQTLFSAIHGLVIIGLENHDVGVKRNKLDEEIAALLKIIVRGLN